MFYMQELVNNKLNPSYALILDNKNNHFKDLIKICKNNEIEYETLKTSNINDIEVVEKIRKREENYFIFSGGGILSKEIVNIKKFIHIHPGILPEYKGSTCFYYSLLNDKNIGASAFIMKPEIDSGEIIAKKVFPLPKTMDLDNYYDPFIRSRLLLEIIKNRSYVKTRLQTKKGKDYYIIHPVLKHIALLDLEKEIKN